MKFWDSSAIIPLLVAESSTGTLHDLLVSDRRIQVWWATEIECASAIARLAREGVEAAVIDSALTRLHRFREDWSEIVPGSLVKESAKRFLRLHVLRAADALQLAAAAVLAEGNPGLVPIVSLDERLRAAARREGHPILPL
jgi:uncharacterized protein